MNLRNSEITAFEPTSTSVDATPMPIAFIAPVVTASIGQVPKSRQSTGFSLMIPFENSCVKEVLPIVLLSC